MRPALPLLAAVLLVTSGCLGVFGPSRPPSDERAVDAVDAGRAATTDITGYHFAVRAQVSTTGDDGQSVTVDGDGRVDVRDRRLTATTRADDRSLSAYLANDTLYTECTRMGWGRRNLSVEGPWVDHTPLGRQLAILERTNVYWERAETGTIAVSARPTERELRTTGEGSVDTGASVGGGNVRNVTTRAWFDAESHRLVRVRHAFRVAQGGDTARATVTLRFEYGSVDVSRPAFDPESMWQTGCPGA